MQSNRLPTHPSALGTEIVHKTAYHHGDLRSTLIEAARQLINEKGPEGFSVSEACRLAGVSTAAPYKHFKNKQEILLAVLLSSAERHAENMQAVVRPYPSGDPARITALNRNYIEAAMEDPGIFALRFDGAGAHLNSEAVKTAEKTLYGIVLQEIAACLGEPEVNDRVHRRGFMMWSCIHGLTSLLKDRHVAKEEIDFDLGDFLDDVTQRILA